MLASTASFINCVGGTNGDNPTEITRSDIDDVVRVLLGNDAYTIGDYMEGKLFALLKSSLIEVDTEVAFS